MDADAVAVADADAVAQAEAEIEAVAETTLPGGLDVDVAVTRPPTACCCWT